jgi:pimeloyl-ACP methyl ester carboxylesterase
MRLRAGDSLADQTVQVNLMATNWARIVLTFSLLTLPLAGCLHVPDPVVPMPIVRPSGETVRHSTAIVLLPGIRDRGQTFVDEGFFDAAMLSADVYAADAHFGYYRNRTAVERLYQDILLPLKRRGYEHIWLAGISLGGLGAVLTAAEHPGVIDGLVLLSPYVGDRKLAAEVRTAGGLLQWEPGELGAEDYDRRALSWLRDESQGAGGIELFLGFGSSDDFAPLLLELRPVFPDGRFVVIEGGHDWPTWRRLWTRIATERFAWHG